MAQAAIKTATIHPISSSANGDDSTTSADSVIITSDQFPFMNDWEWELAGPVIQFVALKHMPEDSAFDWAHELYSRSAGSAVDQVVFASYVEHWQMLGASTRMILAACAIICARETKYNTRRAVSSVIGDFIARRRDVTEQSENQDPSTKPHEQ